MPVSGAALLISSRAFAQAPNPAKLVCDSGKRLNVVGLTALDASMEPLNPSQARASCDKLDGLEASIRRECNGKESCTVGDNALVVTEEECPTIASISIDVFCEKNRGKYMQWLK